MKERNKWLVLIVVALGAFLAIFNATIINVSLITIAEKLGSTLERSQWLVSGYILSMSVTLIASGNLAKRFGYKKIYLLGAIIFTIGAIMCGLTHNIYGLITTRIVQGIGAGAMVSLSMSIIGHSFEQKSKGTAVGVWVMATGAATSVGVIVGGYFVSIDRWQWIFEVNIPLGIALVILSALVINRSEPDTTHKFDIIGLLLLLIWAPISVYLLSAKFDIELAVIMIISFLLFLKEMRRATHPLVELNIFKDRNFVISFISMCCFGIALQGGSYVISQFLLNGMKESALQSGMTFVPVTIVVLVLSPIVGFLTNKLGNKVFILMGLLFTLAYLLISAQLTASSSLSTVTITMYLRAIGAVFALTAITNLSLHNAPKGEIESRSGVINMSKQLSGSLAISATTTLITINNEGSSLTTSQAYTIANRESFDLLAAIAAITLIIFILLRKTKK